jgi:alpha-L-fucosidase
MNRIPNPRCRNSFKPSFLAAAVFLSSMRMASSAEPPPPFGAVPHERQVAWQRMEYYGFVHFGLNTWTDLEWGYGDEDEKLFDPASFDARAIGRHFKEAGMKGLILTAKHQPPFPRPPVRPNGSFRGLPHKANSLQSFSLTLQI